MNDIEALNEETKKEIENSPALKMVFIRIEALNKALDDALKQRAKDWEQIQEMARRLSLKTCQCGKTVLASEFHIIYEATGTGVCNDCYMHQYLPYTEPFSNQPTH